MMGMFRPYFIALILLLNPLFANEPSESTDINITESEKNFDDTFFVNTDAVLKTVCCTAFALIVVFLAVYIMKKRGLGVPKSSHITIKDKICISPKTTIYLAETTKKELVIVESSVNIKVKDITSFEITE